MAKKIQLTLPGAGNVAASTRELEVRDYEVLPGGVLALDHGGRHRELFAVGQWLKLEEVTPTSGGPRVATSY